MTAPEALRPYVALLLAKAGNGHTAPVFALHHEEEWEGEAVIEVDGREVELRWCPSELAVREALLGAERRRPLVLVTPVMALGADLLARLSIRRVAHPRPADALAHVFALPDVDPAIPTWMMRALVDAAPVHGYERTGARTLDLDRAWRALLRHAHGIEPDRGLAGLLEWAEGARAASLDGLGEPRRSDTLARIEAEIRGAGPVLAAVAAGHGRLAAPLGLAMRALVDGPAGPSRIEARTRLEPLLGGWRFDERAAGLWAEAAEQALASLELVDEPAALTVRHEAERLIEQLSAGTLAGASEVLSSGLRLRLAEFAAALDARAGIEAVATRVERHRLAQSTGAAGAARIAARLARWLQSTQANPSSLAEAAAQYVGSDSYADMARTILRFGGGDSTLDEALRHLVADADERRGRQEVRFGELLAAWSPHAQTHADLLGVEDLLAMFVAPLASQRSVLVLVMDGMSHRVADELLEDAVRSGWTELRREGRPRRAFALAALPSITTYSRASLFSGRLLRGLAAEETTAFAAHPELLAASGNAGAPLLFHKGALADAHAGLAAAVREAIASERRIVGAVINAIDDHLARSEQLRTPWSVADVPLLRSALDAAREADRLVVLLADHGHVIERGGRQRSNAGQGGERWRATPPPPQEGELLIEGPRVLAAGGPCVMAVDEQLRYAPRKHGYHGGATAQEMLVPVLVLAPRPIDRLNGWVEAPYDPPSWWSGIEVVAVPVPAQESAAPALGPGGQLTLDVSTVPIEPGGWIAALLASDTLSAQRGLAARTPLSDERIAALLAALEQHGGRMLRSALAQAGGIAPGRIAGTLASLQLVLNVDGYPVLSVDEPSDTVTLNVPLLREQFALAR